jgi:DNA polymerase I-like protein with 3'-5' exonuclease and polymerase domains
MNDILGSGFDAGAQPISDLMSGWARPETLPDPHNIGDIAAVDLETNDVRMRAGLGPGYVMGDGYICGISIAYRNGCALRSLYVPIRHPETDNFDRSQAFAWLKHVLATVPRLVFHNALYDCGWLLTEADIAMPSVERLHDTGALATIVNENLLGDRPYSLDNLCKWRGIPGKDETLLCEAIKARLGVKPSKKKNPPASFIWQMPAHLVGPYAEQDARATLALFENLYPILDQEGTGEAYKTEIKLLPLVQEMGRRGVRVDLDEAERNRDYFRGKRDAVFAELSAELGCPVSMDEIGSTPWLASICDKRGIKYPRTEKGNPSFQGSKDGWMRSHPDKFPPLVALADRYNNAAEKFLQRYIIEHAVNGRLHPEANPHRSEDKGTRSTRFSYSGPPLQQMPSRDPEITPRIRGVFLPEEGEYWGKTDYRQQEVMLVVHYAAECNLTGAAELVELYKNHPETDFHAVTATKTGRDRFTAKTTNFLIFYGGAAKRLAGQLGISEAAAREIIDEHRRGMPCAYNLSEHSKKVARERGYLKLGGDGARQHFNLYEVRGIEGGKGTGPCLRDEAARRVNDPEHPWYGRQPRRAKIHKALNALIQGTGARQTKLLMLACWNENIVPAFMMHDGLDFSTASPEPIERVAQLGAEVMPLRVPMRMDVTYGRNWADATHTWAEVTGQAEASGPRESVGAQQAKAEPPPPPPPKDEPPGEPRPDEDLRDNDPTPKPRPRPKPRAAGPKPSFHQIDMDATPTLLGRLPGRSQWSQTRLKPRH